MILRLRAHEELNKRIATKIQFIVVHYTGWKELYLCLRFFFGLAASNSSDFLGEF